MATDLGVVGYAKIEHKTLDMATDCVVVGYAKKEHNTLDKAIDCGLDGYARKDNILDMATDFAVVGYVKDCEVLGQELKTVNHIRSLLVANGNSQLSYHLLPTGATRQAGMLVSN
ncbi:hypothetical protein CHS0354_031577 [Potamilus streckersoni]|uniref:Uncharacterized protein n=1 Tax=Potamilus streckersoni TaxID=2493646 RepID=A0AAE0SGB0_9BIVA|nr:hypothetical protein CHS0354_031577 [Potamilus streckersoni]